MGGGTNYTPLKLFILFSLLFNIYRFLLKAWSWVLVNAGGWNEFNPNYPGDDKALGTAQARLYYKGEGSRSKL